MIKRQVLGPNSLGSNANLSINCLSDLGQYDELFAVSLIFNKGESLVTTSQVKRITWVKICKALKMLAHGKHSINVSCN